MRGRRPITQLHCQDARRDGITSPGAAVDSRLEPPAGTFMGVFTLLRLCLRLLTQSLNLVTATNDGSEHALDTTHHLASWVDARQGYKPRF
jgi:hypothetical protein